MQAIPQTWFAIAASPRVYGRRLEPGDVLEPTDVYNSSNGHWEFCPVPGFVLQPDSTGNDVIWVRPEPSDSSSA
jgi:hypothetical protein